MPEERAPLELYDIEEAVQKLRHVLGDRSFEEIEKDFVLKAAAERFVESSRKPAAASGRSGRRSTRRCPGPRWRASATSFDMSTGTCGSKSSSSLRGIDLEALEAAVAHLMRKYDPEGVALRERLRASGELPLPPSTPKAD